MSADYERRYDVFFAITGKPVDGHTSKDLELEMQRLRSMVEGEEHCECLHDSQRLLVYGLPLRCYPEWKTYGEITREFVSGPRLEWLEQSMQ